MTEQLAFGQTRRNRRAIQFDQRLGLAGTAVVDGPRSAPLPGAGFAGHQYRGLVPATVSTSHSTARNAETDHFLKIVFGLDLVP